MNTELTKTNETGQKPAVRPRVDVFENDAEYLVVADVPGAPKDGIEVSYEEGELRLVARRAPEALGNALAEEYKAHDFRRSFAMPEGVDAEKISAELAGGVLNVHLPKVGKKRPQKIDVRAS